MQRAKWTLTVDDQAELLKMLEGELKKSWGTGSLKLGQRIQLTQEVWRLIEAGIRYGWASRGLFGKFDTRILHGCLSDVINGYKATGMRQYDPPKVGMTSWLEKLPAKGPDVA